jgi:hypothetical protein
MPLIARREARNRRLLGVCVVVVRCSPESPPTHPRSDGGACSSAPRTALRTYSLRVRPARNRAPARCPGLLRWTGPVSPLGARPGSRWPPGASYQSPGRGSPRGWGIDPFTCSSTRLAFISRACIKLVRELRTRNVPTVPRVWLPAAGSGPRGSGGGHHRLDVRRPGVPRSTLQRDLRAQTLCAPRPKASLSTGQPVPTAALLDATRAARCQSTDGGRGEPRLAARLAGGGAKELGPHAFCALGSIWAGVSVGDGVGAGVWRVEPPAPWCSRVTPS